MLYKKSEMIKEITPDKRNAFIETFQLKVLSLLLYHIVNKVM